MPYIQPENRVDFMPAINELADLITNKGELNFVITKLLISQFDDDSGYTHLTNLRSVLMDVYGEFTRRVLDPYEDIKIIENGDVY